MVKVFPFINSFLWRRHSFLSSFHVNVAYSPHLKIKVCPCVWRSYRGHTSKSETVDVCWVCLLLLSRVSYLSSSGLGTNLARLRVFFAANWYDVYSALASCHYTYRRTYCYDRNLVYTRVTSCHYLVCLLYFVGANGLMVSSCLCICFLLYHVWSKWPIFFKVGINARPLEATVLFYSRSYL
jgi:hypothetical protein